MENEKEARKAARTWEQLLTYFVSVKTDDETSLICTTIRM